MTKTQQKLIERAAQSSQGVVVVITGFNTARKFGQKSYGSREHAAAISLAEQGKLKFLHSVRGIQYGKYGADHYTNHVFQVVRG